MGLLACSNALEYDVAQSLATISQVKCSGGCFSGPVPRDADDDPFIMVSGERPMTIGMQSGGNISNRMRSEAQ